MAKFKDDPTGDRSAITLEEVVAEMFGQNASHFRSVMAGSSAIIQDCRAGKGRHTLWPCKVSHHIAVATGPGGAALSFDIVEDPGSISRFTLREAIREHIPLCLWDLVLSAGDWEKVLSCPIPLPGKWVGRTKLRDLAELPLSGRTNRDELGSTAVMGAEMGFVATSSEDGVHRRYELRIYATSRFAGPAIVELQFLGPEGKPLRRKRPTGEPNPWVRPQLVTFCTPSEKHDHGKDRRIVAALGGTVVSTRCEWMIPRDLSRVRACRIIVRPLTPTEVLQLSESATAIPVIRDEKGDYTACRKRSSVALANANSMTHGFLLGVTDKANVLEQLASRLDAPVRDADCEKYSDLADTCICAMDRGTDSPVLKAGAWDDERLQYLYRMYWNRIKDQIRQSTSKSVRVSAETDVGKEYNIAQTLSLDIESAETSRREGLVARLVNIVAKMDYDTYEEVLGFAREYLDAGTNTQWHRELGEAVLACEDDVEDLASRFGQDTGTVRKARQRLLKRLRNAFLNRSRSARNY
jgi:hypothetical protein